MPKPEPRMLHGTAIAEVEIQMIGDFPAKWMSLELPSILQQILERGALHSHELENVRFVVRQKGVMAISSTIAPRSLDHLFPSEIAVAMDSDVSPRMMAELTNKQREGWAGEDDGSEYGTLGEPPGVDR